MTNTERLEWLRRRQAGLGGSDIAAICGLTKYKTALDVYRDKVDPITEEEPASQAAYWGTILEDLVAKEFASRTGLKVQRVNKTLTGANPWELANIDRAIVNPDIAGNVRVKQGKLTTNAILECKTANQFFASHWGPSQEEEIKQGIEPQGYLIPKYYVTQCQWYLHVTGADICYVAVLIGASDYRIYKVPRNQQIIDIITQEASTFWNQHVIPRIEPAPANAEEVSKKWSQDNGDLVECDNETAIALSELRRLNSEIKALEEEAKTYKDQLIVKIGEHKGLTVGGDVVATYSTTTSNRFNSSALKKADLALYNQYLTKSVTRRFCLK